VVTNGRRHSTTVYEQFLDAILSSSAEYQEASRGDQIILGGLIFDVLHPVSGFSEDINENSLVLRISYGQTTFLFMGDSSEFAEESLLQSGQNLDADILKLGHHGSCAASGTVFLRAVSPEVGIYSAGVDNPYGHPCTDTVAALETVGAHVFGTAEDGTIVVSVTPDGYVIQGAYGELIRRQR